MNVGFLENHLSVRGTSVSLYEYAHFNESMLNNKSFVITRKFGTCFDEDETFDVHEKFSKRFNERFLYYSDKESIQKIIDDNNIKVLYIIKSGQKDELMDFKNCRTIIHCVFTTRDPHGDFYCCISPWLNLINQTKISIFPHMISLTKEHITQFTTENVDVNANLRKELNIPEDAYVIGRYGGFNQFDVQFVHQVINEISNSTEKKLFFLFMNTKEFNCNKTKCKFLDSNVDMYYKLKFVNTCNALLHARRDGETFGLTIGEFAVNDKQIITLDTNQGGYAKNHFMFLGPKCHKFKTPDELKKLLLELPNNEIDMKENGYKQFLPENVMKFFGSVLNHLNQCSPPM